MLLIKSNFLGAIVAVSFLLSAILVFTMRLIGKPSFVHWIGIFELSLALPLLYLVFQAPKLDRPAMYYIQLCLMLTWLIVEFLLDYLFKYDFRSVAWILISYVVLFFAASGGMIGIAAYAGRGWCLSAVFLFVVMSILAFVQRAATGM